MICWFHGGEILANKNEKKVTGVQLISGSKPIVLIPLVQRYLSADLGGQSVLTDTIALFYLFLVELSLFRHKIEVNIVLNNNCTRNNNCKKKLGGNRVFVKDFSSS